MQTLCYGAWKKISCYIYVSPLNEGRHIFLLLLSEACPDHNFFVFPDRSMIFGMWVHDHKGCVAYRNDLRGTFTFDLKVK